MATKIGYVQREPTEQINWAEVGSNFSSILSEEARVREEKKAEIDRATREQQRVLDDAVTGDSANMNDWSLDFAAEAQNQLLMTNSLLKNGQLKPKDYTVIRQNLADGTDQAMTLAQEYQNEYSEKMARAKANPGSTIGPDGKPIVGAQALEEFLMGTAEGFGNFSKSKLVINPQSGNVSVGFINDKGELESDPNKLVGINTLRNRIKDKIDAYDIDSAIIKVKDGQLGVVSQVINKMGGLYEKGFIQTTTGVQIANETTRAKMVAAGTMTQEESNALGQYAKTEDSWVESQLSNEYNITSLLTNNLGGIAPNGEAYTFTYDPSEENENTILLRNEGNKAVPDFTSAQGKLHRETAKEGLKTRLRGSLDIETKVQTVGGTQYRPAPQPSAAVIASGNQTEDDNAIVGVWGHLYNGTPEQQAAAPGIILGTKIAKEMGMSALDNTSKPGYVIITYDGSGSQNAGTRTVRKVDENGDPIGFENFARSGNEVTGVDNVGPAVKAAGGDATREYVPNSVGTAKRERTKGSNPLENLKSYTKSSAVPDNLFNDNDGDKFADYLNSKYVSLGFTTTENRTSDKVTMTGPGGVTMEFRYDVPGNAKEVNKQIADFVFANTPKETTGELLSLKALSSSRQGGSAGDFNDAPAAPAPPAPVDITKLDTNELINLRDAKGNLMFTRAEAIAQGKKNKEAR